MIYAVGMANERLEEIMRSRTDKRQQLLDLKQDPYPAEVRRTHTVQKLAEDFKRIKQDKRPVVVVGRVMAVRKHGGLSFVDLRDGTGNIQLQMVKDELTEEQYERLKLLDAGDFIQAAGRGMVTERGVDTLLISEWHFLAKSIRPLPSNWHGLKDQEQRMRVREIDLLLNEEARKVIELRSQVMAWLRKYLIDDGYLEVSTPILETLAGGTAAKPFKTHHNALDMPLYLRIAAELPLKRLLAGGLEKVFEMGPRFRNEGVDREHNPEFTMLESQWAYADYEDLMDFTEEVMEKMCRDLLGKTDITWRQETLAFARPMKRVKFIDLFKTEFDLDILEEKNLSAYERIIAREGLDRPKTANYGQMIDALFKQKIRPKIVQPTMVYDYPIEMDPLAKASRQDKRVAEKFHLVAAGMELNKCYTEQNDPVEQRRVLLEQERAREAGDEEAHQIDEVFLKSMEYGMPPNAGWSLGIDRVVMILANAATLRDTMTFPLVKPEKIE